MVVSVEEVVVIGSQGEEVVVVVVFQMEEMIDSLVAPTGVGVEAAATNGESVQTAESSIVL